MITTKLYANGKRNTALAKYDHSEMQVFRKVIDLLLKVVASESQASHGHFVLFQKGVVRSFILKSINYGKLK